MTTALLASPALAVKKDLTLVVTQLPAQVRLISGESIALSLSSNATTGYTWDTKVSGKGSPSRFIKAFTRLQLQPA